MTGRYPVRYGMASRNIMRIVPFLSAKAGLPPNETTYAEMLQEAGYATALVGKWHIGTYCDNTGCQDPIGQGFQYYYGVPLTNLRDCRGDSNVFIAWDEHIYRDIFITYIFLLWGSYSLKKRNIIGRPGFMILFAISTILCGGFYAFIQGIKMMNCLILENRKVVEQPYTYDNLANRMTQRAVNFLEVNHDKPFMLTMSFLQAHTALFSSDKFTNRSKHGPYGDTVEEMDYSLGEVMATLKRLGIADNTFVYLTSDNGGHVEEITEDDVREGGWNGIYKGSKGSSYEGGIRVPTVVSYPGIIPAGLEASEPTHIIDALPTIADVVGIPLPEDRVIDGKSMMPLLTNTRTMSDHEFMYHYCGGYMHGVRYRPREGSISYKIVYMSVRLIPGPHGVEGCFNTYACQCYGSSTDYHNPPLVYDITNDPSESSPLDTHEPFVQDIIGKVGGALEVHKASLSQVPYQFSLLRLLPRPWAQPCCGVFPFCSCREQSGASSLQMGPTMEPPLSVSRQVR
ncbi:steryl-sulfatase-like isoform X2 [Amphiura filiformis]